MSSTKDIQPCYNEQDLIELVRAVKFSDPDASVQSVHREITEEISKTKTFEFLSSVSLRDVETVWDKALDLKSPTLSEPHTDDKVVRFYTVGDGSVKKLAESFSLKAAAKVNSGNICANDSDSISYAHCFLDVPADLSGTKPFQALINFSPMDHEHDSNEGDKASTEREIVKIQTAESIPGYGPTPMLLYNKDRSCKTFIHPSSDQEDDGYLRIRNQIEASGVSGVLNGGGKKGYFYALVSKNLVDGQRIISVDLSTGLLPTQPW
jgi:hypothetical protein